MYGPSPLETVLAAFQNPASTATNSADTLDNLPLREFAYSRVFDPASVGTGLQKFSEYIGTAGIEFIGDGTPDQEAFLRYLTAYGDQIRNAGLSGCASHLNTMLNDFLQQVGSSRRFEPFNGIGMVTLYELATKWYNQGTPGTIRFVDGENYKAFKLKDPEHINVHQVVGDFECYVITIQTQSGHTLHLSELPNGGVAPASAMDLVNEVHRLHTANPIRPLGGYDLTLPVIEFRTETRPDWLLGLKAQIPGQPPMFLTDAFQDYAYRINELGAEAKVVTGMVMSRSASLDPCYMLNRPFYFWVTAKGSNLPLGLAYLDLRDTGIPA
ncbi:MAG TPA: hypothetical protein VLG92_05090 [Candidatus Saccharimonadia bacterium]|nr:hypothetical protein [Candidatus Saccharimonadia bacterium]